MIIGKIGALFEQAQYSDIATPQWAKRRLTEAQL
jgi:hypothetical protein